jgi:hypothetical protein
VLRRRQVWRQAARRAYRIIARSPSCFESNEPVEPDDAMAVLLDRLVAVQTKLEDIRAGVAALRE